MIGTHATTPELDHAGTQTVEPRQPELSVRVQAPHPLRRARHQEAIGTDHVAAVAVDRDKMLAEGIEQVAIEARR